VAHLHTCINCGTAVDPGGDCEFDRDHPYQLCDDCRDIDLNDSEPNSMTAARPPSAARLERR
jgi:hypothetical protein